MGVKLAAATPPTPPTPPASSSVPPPSLNPPNLQQNRTERTHHHREREREREGGGGKRKPEAHLHIRKQAGRLEAIDSLQIVVIGRPDVLISEIQLDTEADENNFIVRCTISSSSSSSSSSFISFHSCSLLASLCCFFLRCSAYYFLGIALQLVVIGPVKKQHIWLRKGGVSGSAGGDSSASDSR